MSTHEPRSGGPSRDDGNGPSAPTTPTTAADLELQRDVAVALCAAAEPSDLARILLDACVKLDGVDSGVLYIVEPRTGGLSLQGHRGLGAATVETIQSLPRDSLLASLARAGRPVHGHYATLGFAVDEVRRAEGLRAVSIVPLCSGRRVVACLAVASHSRDELPSATCRGTEIVAGLVRGALGRCLAGRGRLPSGAGGREAFDLLPSAVFEVDAGGRVGFLNRAALEQGGYSQADVDAGLYATDLVVEADRERVRENIGRVLRGERLGAREYLALRKSGERFPCLLDAAPIIDASGPIGLRGVIVDVTERKLAEQERQRLAGQLEQAMKLEAVGRLAGGVAHDFNNLLTTVVGYASLARLSLEPASPIAPMLCEIQRAAESGAQLTQHLLAFSRKQVVSPKVLDCNEVINGMHAMLARLLGEQVELRLELEPAVWPIFADAGQCQQILVNLAVNARDAMPQGGAATIRTRNVPAHTARPTERAMAGRSPGARTEPATHDEVWLSLSDEGVGMDDATLGQIFEPFFTTKPRGQGTGLGLAMTYGAVRQHGGEVEVESTLGRGTTVTLRYPRHAVAGAESEAPHPPDFPRGTESILVVEDEPLVREMVARVLEQLGYRVIACRNGDAAMSVCARADASVDLVVTDVVMPGMSGPVLAQKLRLTRADLPVLFTSGHGEDVIAKHGVANGGVHFLPKPYTPKELAQKIRQILDER